MILESEVVLDLEGPAATERLGAALASALQVGDMLLLYGDLGAGKSTLARGLVRGLTTPDEDVPSPTFTLVQFYEGRGLNLAHFDLYRVTDPDEAYEIGLDEALETGAAVVEWPQRLGARLPGDRLDIDLVESGEGRRARLTPHGSWRGRAFDW